MAAVVRVHAYTDHLGREHTKLVRPAPAIDHHAASRAEDQRRHESVRAAVRMHGMVENAVHPTEAARAIVKQGMAQMSLQAVKEGWTPYRMERELPQPNHPDRSIRRGMRVGESVRAVVAGLKAMPDGLQEARPQWHRDVREFHGEFANISRNRQFDRLANEGANILHQVEAERHDGVARLHPGERELLGKDTVGGFCRPSNVAAVAAVRLGMTAKDLKPLPRKLDAEAKAKADLRATIKAAMRGEG